MSFFVQSKGFSIKELPILFIERAKGQSKMSFKIMLEGVSLVLRLALMRLFRFRNTSQRAYV